MPSAPISRVQAKSVKNPIIEFLKLKALQVILLTICSKFNVSLIQTFGGFIPIAAQPSLVGP